MSALIALLVGVGLNAALIAANSAGVLRAPRLLEVVDASRIFTINLAVPAEGLAKIRYIDVWVNTKFYPVYPQGEIPEAGPGATFDILVTCRNDGGDGNMWARLTDDDGVVLYEFSGFVASGDSFWCDAFNVSMPERDYTITLDTGHIA